MFHDVPTLSPWYGLRTVRRQLWDPDYGRLVTFAEAGHVRLSYDRGTILGPERPD